MNRYAFDQTPYLIGDVWRAPVAWIKHADAVHQLYDRDGGMVGMPSGDDMFEDIRRPTLQLIDIDACVKQERTTTKALLTDKRQVCIRSPGQGSLWIEPRPSQRGIDVESRHVSS